MKRRLTAVLALAVAVWCGGPVAIAAVRSSPALPHHDLSLRLDAATRTLEATDTITVPSTNRVNFLLNSSLHPTRILVDGSASAPATSAEGNAVRYALPLVTAKAHTIVVSYEGTLAALTAHTEREVLGELPAMIGADGGYLPAGAGWYPDLDTGPCTYRAGVDVGADQRAVMPGRLVSEATENDRYRATFEFLQPIEGLTLMVGPYVVQEQRLSTRDGKAVQLRTYFHPAIAELGDEYLSAAAHFVEMYSAWIGPYPYASFSIVSSPLPSGLGMPSLTYLGVDVLRLPFIKSSSLGHEILHNWWGNGVRVAWDRGNWSEALTTFMGDYTFKEQDSAAAARDMRWAWLRDFAAIPAGQDRPVRAFTARTHGTSQIVGYDKGAFLFFMLRDEIGQEAFDRGMRRFWRDWQFRSAAWDDLRRSVEASTGRNLTAFFDQWLARTGAPTVRIDSARWERTPGGYRVHVTLAQDAPAYAVRIPMAVTTDAGREIRVVALATVRQAATLDVRSRPRAIVLDPDFRLFRRLAPSEVPPILRDVMLDPAAETLILSPGTPMRDAAAQLARRFLEDREPKLARDDAVRGPLLVIGSGPEVDAWAGLSGIAPRPDQLRHGTAQVWATRIRQGAPVVIVSAAHANALAALIRPLPHYGRQSYLVFEGANAVDRGVWPAQSPAWRLD